MSFNGVLIMDCNQERRSKLEAILSFMQVEWRSGCRAEDKIWLQEQPHTLTVLAGDMDVPLKSLVNEFSHHAFISLNNTDCQANNLLGTLSALTYDELTALLQQAQSWQPLIASDDQECRLHDLLIGQSASMDEIKSLIRQVANKPANVLLLGESGTGKEVIARAIHLLSLQSEGPFVPINCGAIPAELLESELFGHEKGAFTGAVSARKGRFELAQGGTLFLDEIGDMPLPMQVKLLRVLQERTFERVGGTRPITAKVRVIAATHRDLEQMIAEQRFREDLYYRLNVFPIEAPALRHRQNDIPLLLNELISRHETTHNAQLSFSAEAIDSLKKWHWPGNVRELSNLVERMFILCPNQRVQLSDLPVKYQALTDEQLVTRPFDELDEQDALASIFHSDEPEVENEADFFDFQNSAEDEAFELGEEPEHSFAPHALSEEGVNLKEMLANIEMDMISQSLEANDGVVARAAEHLGMRRTTLVEKMKKYGITK
ncbi:sigma-54 dependent transcriptional regulator [Oceanisphaera pacifica]|uniref:Sigma-54-dependent Fis family transcriptional regulator n=1 Tax=Oceanisphaera pacifica TaxID=2818389 RepID=A0ABS3NJZ9_9GAMM|nr:sigma-54-dependent Fis family transcriptional regulator [Oceanisphaera pacifica]MBO1520743.1 sigma-54-dependent Fis family transcriptional regulator [Oceanisphaera pacifica]